MEEIDLLATWQKEACSKEDHSPGCISETFLLHWKTKLLYAFPTIPLVWRSSCKLRQAHTMLILITPAWPHHQCWFLDLLNLFIWDPISLLQVLNIASQTYDKMTHPDPHPTSVMDAQRLSSQEMKCSLMVQSILLNSRKPSTRNIYFNEMEKIILHGSRRKGHLLHRFPHSLFWITSSSLLLTCHIKCVNSSCC